MVLSTLRRLALEALPLLVLLGSTAVVVAPWTSLEQRAAGALAGSVSLFFVVFGKATS